MEDNLSLYRVWDIAGKGRGCVSLCALKKDQQVLLSRPDIAVLYTPFTTTVCARCFISSDHPHLCDNCKRFALCGKCNAIPGLLEWHQYECTLFCGVPASMRDGDTDYLRFVLRYFSILVHGPPPSLGGPVCEGEGSPGAMSHFHELCSNNEKQTKEVIAWCNQFAGLFARYFGFPEGETVSSVAELLMRIRSNSIGFPFNVKETMGWCLDIRASMFNHSCDSNCFVTQGPDGTLLIKTKVDVKEGEELCFSYIDLFTDEFKDKQTRRTHLMETYCFLCACPLCSNQKAVKKNNKNNKP